MAGKHTKKSVNKLLRTQAQQNADNNTGSRAKTNASAATTATATAAAAATAATAAKAQHLSKAMLWKDIRKSFSNSKGRFIAIVCLVALGSFALVGLTVTGPDMRSAGNDYFNEHHLADLSVISDYGLDQADRNAIGTTKSTSHVEYGYLKDVVTSSAGKPTDESLRIYSTPQQVSTYELTQGRMPHGDSEIAVDGGLAKQHPVGSNLSVSEQADQLGRTVLRQHTFRVVGVVQSPEIISRVNLGNSTSGSGSLDSFGIVDPKAFNSDEYMIARLTFSDLDAMGDHYSNAYTKALQQHKTDLNRALASRPDQRLAEIRTNKQPSIDQAQRQIDDSKAKLNDTQNQLTSAKQQLDDAQTKINAAQVQIDQKQAQIDQTKNTPVAAPDPNASPEARAQLAQAQAQAQEQLTQAQTQLDQAKTQQNQARTDLQNKTNEYNTNLAQFNQSKPEAEQKISEAEAKLSEAKATLNDMAKPTYSVNSRREAPGADGYTVYHSVSVIVDSLSRIFPYFLYLVAALVTFSTMTRFVEEERINSGTLKALGYSNRDVMKKFVVYGTAASALGALIGIAAGHTLMPAIVYAAYGHAFDMPFIAMNFNWQVTLLAVVLAAVSAVVPAALSAHNELRERPASLLLPKAPSNGSKIMLEHIPFVWNRLSFTHKVTARNIFRYKQRMFMTIFGVAGSVALLMAGFAVQGSISGINAHQFGPVLDYSLIAAHNDHISQKQHDAIAKRLKQYDVERATSVRYENLTKVAGSNDDKQDITLIVPEHASQLGDYVTLRTRDGHKPLSLGGSNGSNATGNTDSASSSNANDTASSSSGGAQNSAANTNGGAIVSERFANLVHAKVGSTIDVQDAGGHSHKVRISGICEMYMGHFMFMSPETYASVFGTTFTSNADLVTLRDGSTANVKHQSASFMRLDGIKGVQQNTALMTQIDTVVSSLNIIMWVLIIVATLLGVVILYNLTNLNVTERIRELSTIKVLGFYNREVTMYIYRETILLSGIGVLAGYLFGAWLHRYIITSVPPDNVMFDPSISWTGFVVPLVLVVVITAVLGWHVNRKLAHIDMLDALKSVD